jgi:hypothetical protein
MPDRRTPFVNGNERETLVAFLDYLREAIVVKTDGLSEADAGRSLVPSGTSLLGLVKHLTMVEVSWFQWSFAADDVRVPGERIKEGDTVASVVASYRAATARNNEIVASAVDLTAMCARRPPTTDLMSLRWILVHMIEETARHAGHADILREQLDGEVGR